MSYNRKMHHFAAYLRALKDAGTSYYQVAKHSGLHVSQVSKLARGLNHSLDAAGKIISSYAQSNDYDIARELWAALRDDYFATHDIPSTIHTPPNIALDEHLERLWAAITASEEPNSELVESILTIMLADTPASRTAKSLRAYHEYTREPRAVAEDSDGYGCAGSALE